MAVNRRNRLLSWWIGLMIIVGAVVYVGWYMYSVQCSITPFGVFAVLGVVPAVYLTLMYLALISQD